MSNQLNISLSNRRDIEKLGSLRKAWGCDSNAATVREAMKRAEGAGIAQAGDIELSRKIVRLEERQHSFMVRIGELLNNMKERHPDAKGVLEEALAEIIRMRAEIYNRPAE